jgi:hypothetical protein
MDKQPLPRALFGYCLIGIDYAAMNRPRGLIVRLRQALFNYLRNRCL